MGTTSFPVDDRSVASLIPWLLAFSEDDLCDLLARYDWAATQAASAVVRDGLDVSQTNLGIVSLPERHQRVEQGRSLFRKYNSLAYELVCGKCSEITPHGKEIEKARKGIGGGLEVLGGLLGSALEVHTVPAVPAAIVAVLVVKQGHRLVCVAWKKTLQTAQ